MLHRAAESVGELLETNENMLQSGGRKCNMMLAIRNQLTIWSNWLISWLGDLDSNQDWRSQSPLSYR